MDIYAKDLGERRRALAAVQARRQTAPGGPPTPEWVRVVPLLVILAGLALLHPGTMVLLAGMLALPLPVLAFRLAPALVRRRQRRAAQDAPLGPAQVARMLAGSDDPLEREYLRLVLAAAQLPAAPAATGAEVREAVRALGAALEGLPPPAAPALGATKLAGKAASLADEADREADPVVAASLRRRAETRAQQAETVALIETLARRQAALRQELSDEMDALQTSLTALRAGGAGSVAEMADVAAGIGGIARKAQATAAARAELEEASCDAAPGGTRQRLQHYLAEDTE